MSKRTEQRAADMAAPMSEAAAAAEVKTAVPVEREVKTGPVVYCGPSVRGVARQYTVYAGNHSCRAGRLHSGPPGGQRAAGERGPIRPKDRSNLGRSGTAEAILFQKVRSEL
jgi:hypothetical protein